MTRDGRSADHFAKPCLGCDHRAPLCKHCSMRWALALEHLRRAGVPADTARSMLLAAGSPFEGWEP